MKPESINIAIAELCGWKWYRIPNSEKASRGPLRTLFLPAFHEIDQDPCWMVAADGTERIANWEYIHRDGLVPNYYSDLNACAEMEKTLTEAERVFYFGNLNSSSPEQSTYACLCFATAPQRCEAFLRTKGKWIE